MTAGPDRPERDHQSARRRRGYTRVAERQYGALRSSRSSGQYGSSGDCYRWVNALRTSPENTVSYDEMAEARIAYGGRGQISDLQQQRYGAQALEILTPF